MLKFDMRWPVKLLDLPRITCVYFVTTNDEVLYIGCTSDLRNRMNSHHCRHRFIEWKATKLLVFPIDDRKEAAYRERTLISWYKPVLNGGFYTLLSRGLLK
jgi:predicted GIY-YIG superfamily endonuclease